MSSNASEESCFIDLSKRSLSQPNFPSFSVPFLIFPPDRSKKKKEKNPEDPNI